MLSAADCFRKIRQTPLYKPVSATRNVLNISSLFFVTHDWFNGLTVQSYEIILKQQTFYEKSHHL